MDVQGTRLYITASFPTTPVVHMRNGTRSDHLGRMSRRSLKNLRLWPNTTVNSKTRACNADLFISCSPNFPRSAGLDSTEECAINQSFRKKPNHSGSFLQFHSQTTLVGLVWLSVRGSALSVANPCLSLCPLSLRVTNAGKHCGRCQNAKEVKQPCCDVLDKVHVDVRPNLLPYR